MAWLLVSRSTRFKDEAKKSKLSKVFTLCDVRLHAVCWGLGFFLFSPLSTFAAIEPNWENQDACFIQPAECVKQLKTKLSKTPKHSHKWYGIKNTYLLALWELSTDTELKAELDSVDIAHAPPVFLTTVYTLKAKFAVFEKDMTTARVYAERAVSLTKAVNEVSDNMSRNAEIVVLYSSYLKDHERAKAFVDWVEQKQGLKPNPVQMATFNTAVGHLYSNNGQFGLARSYYLRALEGYLATDYKVRIAKSYHNVARCLQREHKLDDAIEYYTSSLTFFQELGEQYIETGEYTRLRFAETLLESGRMPQAKFVFSQINVDSLSDYYISFYRDIKSRLEKPTL